MRRRALVVLAPLVLGLCGCGDLSTNDSDCAASVLYKGAVYVSTDIKQPAQASDDLGPGEAVDCDHTTVVDDVVVSRVESVQGSIAIRVAQGTWRGIYVVEGLPKSSWPTELAAS